MTTTTEFVPDTDNGVALGVRYIIKSVGAGTVLDDWGGKVGENSAALMPDDKPDLLNRIWTLVKAGQGFRIKNAGAGTVLDDWGGKVGEDSAALMPDDDPNFKNRIWTLAKARQGFRIKSVGAGTVLDDWGGKVGENSAALMPDDDPNFKNRIWVFVLQIKNPRVVISRFDFGDALKQLLQQGGMLDYALSETTTVNDPSIQPNVSFSQSKEYTRSFSWGLDQKLGFEYATKISCGFDFEGISAGAEESFTESAEFGSHQEWNTTTTVTITSQISATFTKPGVYRLGRLVKQYQNETLPYTAKLTLYGDDPVSGLPYSGGVLAAFLKGQGHDVVEVSADSATIDVKGTVSADFVVSSTTIFEKIRDVPPIDG
jgi:hypothetical protein